MSTKLKRAGKFAGKAMGIVVFTILFAFNIQVAFSDDTSEELNFLGVRISLFNDISGKPVQADDDDGGGGGGGSTESCSKSANCGAFSVSCSASGSSVECIGYDYSDVQCRAWKSNGTLKSYSYKPCP